MTKKDKVNDFMLVTSARHMRGTMIIFFSLGLTLSLYSTNSPISNKITVKDRKSWKYKQYT